MSEISEILKATTSLNYYIFCGYVRNCFFLLLKALDIQRDDEIIVPAFLCESVYQVIISIGAKPVYVDVGDKSINISPDRIKKAISTKTKMIYVVHTFGISAEIKEISYIAKSNNIFLVEDLAHSLFAEYDGKKLGSFGDFTLFSFTKTMINFQGGAVGTNNYSVFSRMKSEQLKYCNKSHLILKYSFYYMYRLLCSVWEAKGSSISLLLLKSLHLLKTKDTLNMLHSVDMNFFYINKVSMWLILACLKRQSNESYMERNNKKYMKFINKYKNEIDFPKILDKQTGLMPKHVCGFIKTNHKLLQFFSLNIWNDRHDKNNNMRIHKLFAHLKLIARGI